MKIKGLIDEDFTNYKKSSMFIATCYCNWKCCIEQDLDNSICQNSEIAKQKNIEISADEIFSRYNSNIITNALVIGGLEPLLQFEEIHELIKCFRDNNCLDDIVIYTGYYDYEIQNEINILKQYPNIIIKFGRFIPNQNSHYDEILGVKLASNNQYAERIN